MSYHHPSRSTCIKLDAPPHQFTLPLTHFSSSSPLLSTVPLVFLFPHEEYFQYARHRRAHQRGCYARARGNAHRLFAQCVSAEICQGLRAAVLTFAREAAPME